MIIPRHEHNFPIYRNDSTNVNTFNLKDNSSDIKIGRKKNWKDLKLRNDE